MNSFINNLKNETNFGYTENGAVKRNTTRSDLLDLFAMGAAYRKRSDEDIIVLFKNAYAENPVYAMKCLFYIRDIRGGQGERRFFRVCLRWLADYDTDAVIRNIKNIPMFGRYDDLYCLVGTKAEKSMWDFLKEETLYGFKVLSCIKE